MIIMRVKAFPFGGLVDKEISFTSGLNVVLGANEAGKSTIFRAIQKGLFTATNLSETKLQAEMSASLPIGGDTAAVEIDFSIRGAAYRLQKKWGGTKFSRLVQPDGTSLTDDKKIAAALGALLPASEGTFHSTLMSYQSGLGNAVIDLQGKSDTLVTLGMILRKAILQADGVSVDEFRTRIERLEKEYLDRWDIEKDQPAPGTKARYVKEVGAILKKFYALEDLRVQLADAKRYEQEVDEVNRLVSQKAEHVQTGIAYLTANEQAVTDAIERRTLLIEADHISQKVARYEKVNAEWPVCARTIETIGRELPGLVQTVNELKAELERAKLSEANALIAETYRRAASCKTAMDAAEADVSTLKKITASDCESLRKAEKTMQLIEGSLSAGKLAARIIAHSPVGLRVTKDLDQPEEKTLQASTSYEVKAGGRIIVEHPEMTIEVTSGDGKFEETVEKFAAAKLGYEQLLEASQICSVDEAIRASAAYEAGCDAARNAQEMLQRELHGESFEALEARVRRFPVVGASRPALTVMDELKAVEIDVTRKESACAAAAASVSAYVKEYGSPGELMKLYGRDSVRQEELTEKLGALTPLPSGETDADRFIRKYEGGKQKLETLRSELTALKIRQAGLEGKAPDISADDVQVMLDTAKAEFDALLKRGRGVARLRQRFDAVTHLIDAGIYSGLERDISAYCAGMTGGTYTHVEMTKDLPDGVTRADGKMLPVDLLSTGTRDVLGLALKLAMTTYFLDGEDGFAAMDDPLVDMDPVRQQHAARVLAEFAKEKQVIVFTCHPAHAAMLGGTLIRL